MNHPIGRRGEWQRRHIWNDLVWLLRVGNEHPHVAVPFAASIGRDANFVDMNGRVFYQRRNFTATACLIEPPPMVGTFDTVVFHFAEGQRHAAMGTNVAHGRDRALRCLADEDREAQQDGPFPATGSDFTAETSGIPAAQERGVPAWLA